MPGFVNYKKGCTRLTIASDKVYQLLAHGRWFSLGTPASSTTKTGRHDIAEILLKVALRHPKNQIKSSYNAKCLYKKDDLSWGSTLVVLHQKSGLIRWSLLGVAWWGRRFGSGLMREEVWEWPDEGGGLSLGCFIYKYPARILDLMYVGLCVTHKSSS